MTIFAKTFIIDDTQVLVFWEYDPDTEEYEWQFAGRSRQLSSNYKI